MKILIVDNHTVRLPEIVTLISKYGAEKVDIVRTEHLLRQDADECDLIILSGATGLAVPSHLDIYNEEFALIRERNKPLLGICAGFQAIATAFGEELEYRNRSINGVINIEAVNKDSIFGDKEQFRVFESHKYFLSQPPAEFITLAKSAFNIEAIKHISKPIYGFQFHPEVTDPPNDGANIFSRFMDKLVRL